MESCKNTLRTRIVLEGKVLSPNVLKVDAFLNHQVDPALTMDIGRTFAEAFQSSRITKVMTVEASGIHIAMATAFHLGVPFVYAKKKRAITQSEDQYTAPVYSYTRQENYDISVSKAYLDATDEVLIVDDILAKGGALLGLVDIVKTAGAHLVGVGVVIEKSFQEGRQKLEAMNVPICALARIRSMGTDVIEFLE